MPSPNFVFLMTDTQGANVIGTYGHPELNTPNIDNLARTGVRFDRAYTTCPVCTPARAGMLSGIYPHTAGAWTNKGAALLDLGRYEEALACFDKALAVNPKLGEAWCNKGSVLSRLGKCEEALACLDKALAINPKLAEAWMNKGAAYYMLGRYADAWHCVKQVRKLGATLPPDFIKDLSEKMPEPAD